jgi:hypothetical protein
MVVSLGSSFSLLTPLISAKPVIVSPPAKEGAAIDFYDTSENIKLDRSGRLLELSLDEARAMVIDRYIFPPLHS